MKINSPITTHVLDVSIGKPAVDMQYKLELLLGNTWNEIGTGKTDKDGRASYLSNVPIEKGTYRLTFETAAYFKAKTLESFYPSVSISFEVKQKDEHYHVPLLLSPFGFSTYRGS